MAKPETQWRRVRSSAQSWETQYLTELPTETWTTPDTEAMTTTDPTWTEDP